MTTVSPEQAYGNAPVYVVRSIGVVVLPSASQQYHWERNS